MDYLRDLIRSLHESILRKKPNIFVAMRIYKLSYMVNNFTNSHERIEYQDEMVRDLIDLITLIANDKTVSSETIQIFSTIVIHVLDHNLLNLSSIDHLADAFGKVHI